MPLALAPTRPTTTRSIDRWVDQPTLDVDAAALVADGRVVSHRELDRLVAHAAATLPPATEGRLLVRVPLGRDLPGIVAHLAVQRAGHVGLLTRPGAETPAPWTPDLTATGELRSPFARLTGTPAHVLHPDLAVLLPTSGSTGSSKLVRISRSALSANAHGIAEALHLRASDRAALALPLHYCFGLSVLHSHLVSGGSVALSEAPVTDPGFWRDVAGSTTLPVVPHTLDLLDAAGDLDTLPSSIRLVTQAGGALGATRLARVRAVEARSSWQLVVMYGQTEATARMTVLDPAEGARPAGVVGRPVAGSSVRIDTTVPEAKGEVGEIVFRGPGVMLGYAVEPADLALGGWTPELRTGDLGRLDDEGLLHVVGRRSAVAKILGLRVDLDHVADRLHTAGVEACVTSDDQRLLVTTTATDADAVATEAARCSGLTTAQVVVATVPTLPRTASGKPDRARCAALALAAVEDGSGAADGDLATRARAALAAALGRPVRLERSFADQGGDSFSLVRATLGLEAVLGPLPRGWHQRPLTDLVRAAAQRPRRRWLDRWTRSVETSVLVRALAVLAICATHVGLTDLPGGAHTLLVVAGYHLAAFTLVAPTLAQRWRRTGALLVGIALPASAVALAVHLTTGAYGWANVVHLNWLLGRVEWGPRIELWFVEALLAAIVVLAGLLSIPPLARLVARRPWECAMALTALALVPRYVLVPEGTGPTRGLPGTVFWFVAAGVALALARRPLHTWLTLALLAVGLAGFFQTTSRGLTVLALVALVALVPRVRVPRPAVPALGALAGASLHIYLVQFQVFTRVESDWLGLLASVAAGLVLAAVSEPVVRRATRRVTDARPGTRATPFAPAPRIMRALPVRPRRSHP